MRKSFLDATPPPNYIPGLGRGAMGFTTRSDIGPARDGPDLPGSDTADHSHPAVQQLPPSTATTAPASTTTKASADDGDNEKEDLSEANYDEFAGYGGSLFDSTTPYDQEDREADLIYASVDDRMESRRKARREKLEREAILKQKQVKIEQQFGNLKRELSTMSVDQWQSIPEATDQVRPHKRRFIEQQQSVGRFTPVPDSILQHARNENATVTSISASLPSPSEETGTDLRQIGMTRNKLLDLKLNGAASSVGWQTSVDKNGYLTDLNSIPGLANTDIGDVKKARLLLKSIRSTNPKNSAAWIGSARLEEFAGQIAQARKIIIEGSHTCPEAEDIWLEAVRLHPRDSGRSLLAEAVQHIPKNVGIWIMAAELEDDVEAKKRVLRRSLELIPGSVRLWKAAIQLESAENARIMLGRAVECVPHSVDMWLALAKLETHENARKVLNTAREKLPTEPVIWISASKLEEAHGGNEGMIKTIIKRAVKSLKSNGVKIDRNNWIAEAEIAEKAGSPETCKAIIAEIADIGLESITEKEKKRQLREDAEASLTRSCVITARAFYTFACKVFATKKSFWLGLAQLEKQHGTKESLDNVLKSGVEFCPKAQVLWLMRAKEQWTTFNDIQSARNVLQQAFAANPESEDIWLAAVKLENESGEKQRAKGLLSRARELCSTERVWRKSAQLERESLCADEEKRILDEGLKKFPSSAKLWEMRAMLSERTDNIDVARNVYQEAAKACPNNVRLWILTSRCEEKQQTTAARGKARAIMERARQIIPKNAELWLESIRVEMRAGNNKIAQTMMAKALQECPKAGILWAEVLETSEGITQAKSKAVDALKNCDDDVNVIIAVARRVFLAERKIEKARSWLIRAVTLRPDFGDAWACLYKLEVANGTEQQQKELVKRCVAADPHHGEHWRSISKDLQNKKLSTEEILQKVSLTF